MTSFTDVQGSAASTAPQDDQLNVLARPRAREASFNRSPRVPAAQIPIVHRLATMIARGLTGPQAFPGRRDLSVSR